jgi:hypothetical protein
MMTELCHSLGRSKSQGWLDWYEGTSKPSFALPLGVVDAHCHVVGLGAGVFLRARTARAAQELHEDKRDIGPRF